jgi:hypothetical protein
VAVFEVAAALAAFGGETFVFVAVGFLEGLAVAM